ncbi:Pentatricopeptide repeat-containing protein [Hibiscus syriacus]|uniref:Pentatricopeptide repeat-containing protein n=1 Tax=Hibiscus syriacus TaxID=106335 RepID=A0A6A2ZCW8_HIBSY|nr:Pentatricopeptide repeat-containing protein [Hibiscus syriacus]
MPSFHGSQTSSSNATLTHSPIYHAIIQAGPRLKPLQQVHARIIVTGSGHSRSLITKLLSFAYAATSPLSYTRHLFFSISKPDTFLFHSLITLTSKFNFPRESLLYYRRMLLANISSSNYTFSAVIKSSADLMTFSIGKTIHCHVLICGYGLDTYVQAALVSFYAKTGHVRTARKIFDKMPQRTIVAWNSMISGYEQNGFGKEAIELFHLMRDSGVKPDSTTFVSLLSACAQVGATGLGCWVHEYIARNCFDMNVVLGTALINMYSRCGNVIKAREVFDSMEEKNIVAWTAIISGYGMHGHGSRALELFNEMRLHGLQPNNVTFVAILSACAHAGLVNEGRRIFASMKQEYGLEPSVEHQVCMVDMLGRAGHLNEAYQFIKDIPKEPAAAVWTAMLGSCKMHKNFDLGVEVAEHLLSLEPENPGHYVMLSNIYALAGRMDRVEKVRNIMIRNRLKKEVGYSTIDVDQKVYLFSMGDKSHPETNQIYFYLDELMSRCREAGYIPASESVMHEVEEEEREHALRYHSEKLAIAFGLLKTGPGVPIKIVKNLRMCEDCHTAVKHISVIANREINVRDRLRFHHFKDGSCTCGDYW